MPSTRRKIIILFSAIAFLAFSSRGKPSGYRFIQGVDISSLLQVEKNGGVFKENGVEKDALSIFRDHNINYVRLRIWHKPTNGFYSLEQTLELARRIKALGMGLLLDFHYSDTWADPAHQKKPAAWENISFNALKDSIYLYSYNVIKALSDENTLPAMVQIGNEIICGMLWDDGRVCQDFNNDKQWSQLAQLINEAIQGLKDGVQQGDSLRIIIHLDRGSDNAGCRWFFNNLLKYTVNFDIIGLSYYPWWHGSLDALKANVNDLAARYGKDIIVIETSYPWTLDWNDGVGNVIGDSSQLHPGYPATVEGQTAFLSDLIEIVKTIPQSRGKGVFYWEPAWVSTPQEGSLRENLTLFDFLGELLPSISAFDSTYTSITPVIEKKHPFFLKSNYPNPFNQYTIISFTLERKALIKLKVYNLEGREIKTLVNGYLQKGTHQYRFNATGLASGIYIIHLQSESFFRSRKMLYLK